MNKRGVTISKSLIKAQLFSFLAETVSGLAIFFVLINIPGTAWSKIWTFMKINHSNPEVFFSDYYQKLSASVNWQDWLVCSPIIFFIGGAVFGLVLSNRQNAMYIARVAAFTSIAWSAVVLILSASGAAVEASSAYTIGYHLPMPQLTLRVAIQIVLQSVYWTVFFVGGSQSALYAFRMRKSSVTSLA